MTPNITFESYKKNALNKIIQYDKSKKGLIDKEILKLVKEINKKKDYYTTSSCAGRIMLIKTPKSGRKSETEWLFSSHKKVLFPGLKTAVENAAKYKEEVWLKQESVILHIACRDSEKAEQLLHIARTKAGFRRAGLISLSRNIIEIIGAASMHTIVSRNKQVLVNDDYLKILLEKANQKMAKNRKRIERFYKEIRKLK